MKDKKSIILGERIEKRIYFIRQQKVMLSTDLAALYEVEPRVLVQAVKRNIERFPEDFMFQLFEKEFTDLKSQIVISSWGGLRRGTPYAFTEQGVCLLSFAFDHSFPLRSLRLYVKFVSSVFFVIFRVFRG